MTELMRLPRPAAVDMGARFVDAPAERPAMALHDIKQVVEGRETRSMFASTLAARSRKRIRPVMRTYDNCRIVHQTVRADHPPKASVHRPQLFYQAVWVTWAGEVWWPLGGAHINARRLRDVILARSTLGSTGGVSKIRQVHAADSAGGAARLEIVQDGCRRE